MWIMWETIVFCYAKYYFKEIFENKFNNLEQSFSQAEISNHSWINMA